MKPEWRVQQKVVGKKLGPTHTHSLSFPNTHTHAHPLSLSFPNTHTHAHALSLSFPNTHTHSYCAGRKHTRAHTHTSSEKESLSDYLGFEGGARKPPILN